MPVTTQGPYSIQTIGDGTTTYAPGALNFTLNGPVRVTALAALTIANDGSAGDFVSTPSSNAGARSGGCHLYVNGYDTTLYPYPYSLYSGFRGPIASANVTVTCPAGVSGAGLYLANVGYRHGNDPAMTL